ATCPCEKTTSPFRYFDIVFPSPTFARNSLGLNEALTLFRTKNSCVLQALRFPRTEPVRIRPTIAVAIPKLNAGVSYFIQTQESDKAQGARCRALPVPPDASARGPRLITDH